jgi:hypothetical protein
LIDPPLETLLLFAHFALPIHSLQNSCRPFRPASLALPISRGASPAPATAGTLARADFAVAGNSTEESTTARQHEKQKDFWTRFPIALIMNDKYRPNIINDDPVTQFDALSQTDHDKSDDSGNANDFLNELSRKFESNEKSLLININNDIGTTSDSLQASDNGKSVAQCRANNSVNGGLRSEMIIRNQCDP